MHQSLPKTDTHRAFHTLYLSLKEIKGTVSPEVILVNKFARYLTSPMPLTLDQNSLLPHARTAEHPTSTQCGRRLMGLHASLL